MHRLLVAHAAAIDLGDGPPSRAAAPELSSVGAIRLSAVTFSPSVFCGMTELPPLDCGAPSVSAAASGLASVLGILVATHGRRGARAARVRPLPAHRFRDRGAQKTPFCVGIGHSASPN